MTLIQGAKGLLILIDMAALSIQVKMLAGDPQRCQHHLRGSLLVIATINSQKGVPKSNSVPWDHQLQSKHHYNRRKDTHIRNCQGL